MINSKNVIRMKVPYPSISSGLAVSSHMYICKETTGTNYQFIKCQTLKPTMLMNNIIQHYCDEQPDITRNPFKQPTRIDCDKLFIISGVNIDDSLLTDNRPDVCEDLFNNVITELLDDGYTTINVNTNNLTALNHKIT